MKYLVYKQDTGKFNGWYDDAVHKEIPTPNMEVTDDDYSKFYNLMNNQGKEVFVINGVITSQDMILPPPTWEEIREQRDLLLDQSDYTQMPDAELTTEQKQAWIDYRKVLRRIPEAFDKPEDVVWPTKPA